MPYAKNGDFRIYYESEGHGPPLLLHQTSLLPQQIWLQTGHVRALHEDYRLILMDPRGVGRSSKPRDPEAYCRAEQVDDILAVLDDLGLRTAHFWGHASGAGIGWFAAKLAPERFRSLVLGGNDPFIPANEGMPHPWHAMLQEQGMEGLVERMREAFGIYWKSSVERLVRANDIEALIAVFAIDEPSGAAKFLTDLQVPLLGYAGTEDDCHNGMKRACEMAPLGRIISLDGLGLVGAIYERERVLPQVVAFLEEVEAGLTRTASA